MDDQQRSEMVMDHAVTAPMMPAQRWDATENERIDIGLDCNRSGFGVMRSSPIRMRINELKTYDPDQIKYNMLQRLTLWAIDFRESREFTRDKIADRFAKLSLHLSYDDTGGAGEHIAWLGHGMIASIWDTLVRDDQQGNTDPDTFDVWLEFNVLLHPEGIDYHNVDARLEWYRQRIPVPKSRTSD